LATDHPCAVFAAIPVKAAAESKSRLSQVLRPDERELLTFAMLRDVIGATFNSQASRDVVVISPDSRVLRLAVELGAHAVPERESGLNRAVEQATRWCIGRGADATLVLPSDIPLLTGGDVNRLIDLGSRRPSMVVSPSDDGGTNALLRCPADVIPPSFGADSFREHLSAAEAAGIKARVHRSPNIALDIDAPDDLRRLLDEPRETHTHRLLEELGISARFGAI